MAKKKYKVGDTVKYDGEDYLVVGTQEEDFDLVIVPMCVIDDECIGISLDDLNND